MRPAFEVHQARMTKGGGSITGDCLAELDAVRSALLLRDSSRARRFLRSSRASSRMFCPSNFIMS